MGRSSLVGACLAVWLAACGDDGESEQVMLDPAEALDELSGPENDALCEALNGQIEADAEYVAQYCTIQGVAAATTSPQLCEDARDACLETDQKLCVPGEAPEPLGCPEVTVSMYVDCFVQMQDRAKRVNVDVSCDSAIDEIIGRHTASLDQLKASPTGACKKVLDVCPGFLD
jgi:hypothetical protein